MAKLLCCLGLLVALAACSSVPQSVRTASACAAGEASYACQVERYQTAP